MTIYVNDSLLKPRWCKILRQNHIKSVNLITINNFSELDYNLQKKKFKKFENLFKNQVSFVCKILFRPYGSLILDAHNSKTTQSKKKININS